MISTLLVLMSVLAFLTFDDSTATDKVFPCSQYWGRTGSGSALATFTVTGAEQVTRGWTQLAVTPLLGAVTVRANSTALVSAILGNGKQRRNWTNRATGPRQDQRDQQARQARPEPRGPTGLNRTNRSVRPEKHSDQRIDAK